MSETIPPEAEPQKAAWEKKNEAAQVAERQLLQVTGDAVPQAVDDLAKTHAQGQPDVARKLGRDGVAALRSDLRRIASALGDDIRHAGVEAKWPTGASLNLDFNVRSAVRGLFTRARLSPIRERLEAAGFEAGTLHGGQFISEDKFAGEVTAVSNALNDANRAARALRTAIDSANESFVDEVWTD